jgi:DNA-binding IclR family transcriptional regulator
MVNHNLVLQRLKFLVMEFERIRKQGYARDVEENIWGAHCLGAPIYLESTRVVGAVS